MKFNICIIKPANYAHSLAFLEIAELISLTLQELGLKSSISFNRISSDAKNIIFGCHLLQPAQIDSIPRNSIIFNTEQLNGIDNNWNQNILNWGRKFEVWDYSDRNIAVLQDFHIENVKRFKFGFQKELVRIEKNQSPNIDVLFYGCLNERRNLILNELISQGIRVKILFNVYGNERDEWIRNSKLVINHHYYDTEIFEIVRVFYLMINSISVVGEVNQSTSIDNIYRGGFCDAPYSGLVENCIKLVADANLRKEVGIKAFETISKFPQTQIMDELL